MGAKKDVLRGLDATVYAPRDQVVESCVKAAEFLGKAAEAHRTNAGVTVLINAALVKLKSNASPEVLISVTEQDGAVRVTARVGAFRTSQSTILFIPVEPKKLVGKSAYFKFLTSLELELNGLVDHRGSVTMTGLAP